jgi:hypothetical protein
MSVRSLFVADARPAARPSPHPTSPAVGRTAVLLAPSGEAGALGALLALALARRARAATAVLLAWRAPIRSASAPAGLSAGRAARSFATHELAASATGRLVRVVLADAEEAAIRDATRAVAAAPATAPVVIALGGPRSDAFDELLAGADVVVVWGAGEEDPRSEIALAGAARVARRAVLWPGRAGVARRRLAAAGLPAPGGSPVPAEVLR